MKMENTKRYSPFSLQKEIFPPWAKRRSHGCALEECTTDALGENEVVVENLLLHFTKIVI